MCSNYFIQQLTDDYVCAHLGQLSGLVQDYFFFLIY